MGKKTANVFGILAAIVLSLVLLVMLVVTPLISAATSLTQEKTLHTIVDRIDLTEQDLVGEDDPYAELLTSPFMSDLLKLYVQDLLAELEGSGEEFLTVEALSALAEEHMDELIPFLHEVADDPEELLPDDELQQELMEYLRQDGQELLNQFPSLAELGVTDEVIGIITALRSKIVLKACAVIAIILSMLVFTCRWPRFKGFMWLAVVSLLGSGLLRLVNLFLDLFVPAPPGLSGAVTPVLDSVTGTLNTAALIYLGVTAVFILVFAFGRKSLRKKAAAAADASAGEA